MLIDLILKKTSGQPYRRNIQNQSGSKRLKGQQFIDTMKDRVVIPAVTKVADKALNKAVDKILGLR